MGFQKLIDAIFLFCRQRCRTDKRGQCRIAFGDFIDAFFRTGKYGFLALLIDAVDLIDQVGMADLAEGSSQCSRCAAKL